MYSTSSPGKKAYERKSSGSTIFSNAVRCGLSRKTPVKELGSYISDGKKHFTLKILTDLCIFEGCTSVTIYINIIYLQK